MAVFTPPRPDLLAYREATTLQFPKLVDELTKIIGKKLTAYIASVKDTRAIDRWIAGVESYKGAEERLRFAYRLAKIISRRLGLLEILRCDLSARQSARPMGCARLGISRTGWNFREPLLTTRMRHTACSMLPHKN